MDVSLFDGHCDTLLHCWRTGEGLERTTGAVDLDRGARLGRYCQFFAIWAVDDMAEGKSSCQVYEEQYRLFRREMEKHRNRIAHCRTAAEAAQAHREGKVAAFLSVEGAHMLRCDLDELRLAYERGVRAVNLTWNNANALSGSCRDEPERGLSGQGRAFVREMQRLGMLVDVSHLSDPGFWGVMEEAVRPVIASHSNARAICPHSRNLTDEQITAIIKNQGIMGLNLCAEFVGAQPDLDAMIGHLEHVLALGGQQHVSLGGDLDGCTPIREVRDVLGWEKLYERLLQKNYNESVVRDLFYNNLMRVVIEL